MPKTVGGIKIYSIHEVAKEFGCSVETIRSYIKKKRIHGQKIGKTWWVTEERMQEFIRGIYHS
jgi:excisionase family DNA binding protein